LDKNNTNNTLIECYLIICKLLEKEHEAMEKIKQVLDKNIHICEDEIKKISKKIKLKSSSKKTTYENLMEMNSPFIAQNHDGSYFLVGKMDGEKVLRYCPITKENGVLSKEEFLGSWNTRVLLVKSNSILGKNIEFGLQWFLDTFKIYKKEIIEVLFGNFSILIFSLVLPIVTQVIIDKVLVHSALTTLNVLTIIFLVVILFDFLTKLAKNYLLLFTTVKIDLILGKKLFRHLFHLPIAYFEKRSVGIISSRVKELESVREFLTGTPINSFLELFFIGIYLILLWIYSPILTGIIIVFVPLILLCSYLIIPRYKKLLEERAKIGAETEAFLVESLTGVQAVKAFALEPYLKKKWSNYQAKATAIRFKSDLLGIIYGITNEKLQKFLELILLIVGAFLVIDQKLSVGQLIAFRMISANLMGPLLKLVEFFRDFEQIKISIGNLAEILNMPSEIRKQQNHIEINDASIEFKNVKFRYSLEGAMLIEDLNFKINHGEVVAFVGRSGSGKSTITKLIQKFYLTEAGEIYIGNNDLKEMNANSLRKNIGVVMQENSLFNGSIRDNIALKHPSANINQIIMAARLAGAHEFILDFEKGYDTHVGENGVGLSGGQKQRIAIARALLSDPKILIFDEATSALDYESERVIKENLKSICKGRTVIMIAHRLSTIKDADRIFVVEKGQIIEEGSHNELIEKDGFYKYLNELQKGV